MSYRVIYTCPYYTDPGEGKRDDIPADTIVEIVDASGEYSQISGKDPNPWKGKWVRTFYLELYTGETDPEDPPPPPFEPDPYLIVERPDGTRYQYVLAPVELQTTILERMGLWIKTILGIKG